MQTPGGAKREQGYGRGVAGCQGRVWGLPGGVGGLWRNAGGESGRGSENATTSLTLFRNKRPQRPARRGPFSASDGEAAAAEGQGRGARSAGRGARTLRGFLAWGGGCSAAAAAERKVAISATTPSSPPLPFRPRPSTSQLRLLEHPPAQGLGGARKGSGDAAPPPSRPPGARCELAAPSCAALPESCGARPRTASRFAPGGRRGRAVYTCEDPIVVLCPRDTIVYSAAGRPAFLRSLRRALPSPPPRTCSLGPACIYLGALGLPCGLECPSSGSCFLSIEKTNACRKSSSLCLVTQGPGKSAVVTLV